MRPLRALVHTALGAYAVLLGCAALATPPDDEPPTPTPTPTPAPAPPTASAPSDLFSRVLTLDAPYDLREAAPLVDGAAPRPNRHANAYACTACHRGIVEEWAASAHGRAWTDARYQASLTGRERPEACWGCHAPEPLHAESHRFGSAPYHRAEELEPRHFGVSCATCHLAADKQTMLGPRGTEQPFHPSAKGETFVGVATNKLCIDCHRSNVKDVLVGVAKDFEVARLAGDGGRCIDCHMRPVERSASSLPGQPVRERRSHALQGPDDPWFLAQAFAPSAARRGDATVVTLANRAGHRVPGLVGRVLAFRAEALDESGAVVATATRDLTTEAPLLVQDTVELLLDAPAARVVLSAEHRRPGAETPTPFLRVELEVAAGADAGAGG